VKGSDSVLELVAVCQQVTECTDITHTTMHASASCRSALISSIPESSGQLWIFNKRGMDDLMDWLGIEDMIEAILEVD